MKFANAAQTTWEKRKLQETRDNENRLVPLINVVFLMLIFFLLVGTIRSELPHSVAPPVSSADQARASQAITISVDEHHRVFINDSPLDSSELSELGNRVRALWPNDVAPGDTRLRRLEIRADKTLTMRRLGPIIKMLSDAGADELSLITQR